MLTPAAPFDAATAFTAASSSDVAVSKCASSRRAAASAAFVPTIRTTIGTSRVCWASGLDEPSGHLVATGDPAEDVHEDGVDLRVGEDQAHGGGHLCRPRAAADIEEVGRFAPGALDEVHRGHREARAVDHAADRAVELDEGQARLARLAVGRGLVVGVAQLLEARMAGERRVVERHLRVEAHEPLDRRAAGHALDDDRERVDLDEVGVVGAHRLDQPLGDRDGRLEMATQAHRERELAGLVVEQPEERVRAAPDDGLGMLGGDNLDLDAALGRAHQQDPALRPVEDGCEVELLDDVGRGADQDLADGDSLDVHAEDLRGDLLPPRPRCPRA